MGQSYMMDQCRRHSEEERFRGEWKKTDVGNNKNLNHERNQESQLQHAVFSWEILFVNTNYEVERSRPQ